MRDSIITSNDSLVDMSGVMLANGLIVPENVNEANRKIVNDIYMRTWLSGIYEFTAEQEATLTGIANQNPLFGGNAVYGARVLLGIEPQDVEEGLRIDNSEATDSENQMQLYPNPARNEVTILYQLEKDEKGEIRISSLTGNTVFSNELTPSDNKVTISMTKYSSGVYLCSYVKDGAVLERQKLVVIK